MSKAATDFSVSDKTYDSTDDYAELLVGCGNNRAKKVWSAGMIEEKFNCLTTLDMDSAANPDVIHDLMDLPYPFEDGAFNEIHAYDVLEHTGNQGDWRFFFDQFSEFWRILRPGGYLCGSVPAWDSVWAWGDPGHTRILSEAALIFLNQREYKLQIGKTAMTDYRNYWQHNFELIANKYEDDGFAFVLQKS